MGSHAAHAPAAHGEHKHHVCSVGLFTKVFVALIVLTVITVWSSRIDFGGFNMPLAMIIASIKAALVLTFFMHLKWDTAMNQITIISSFLFLALLFLFTLGDLTTRSKTDSLHSQAAPLEKDFKKLRLYTSWALERGGHSNHGAASQPHAPDPKHATPPSQPTTTRK